MEDSVNAYMSRAAFPDRITKHGSPDELRWDDNVCLKQNHQGGPRDHVCKKNFDDTLEHYNPLKACALQIKSSRFKSNSIMGDLLCAAYSAGRIWYTAHVKSYFLT